MIEEPCGSLLGKPVGVALSAAMHGYGLVSFTALPKKSSAMPPDVRKAFGLPANPPFGFLGYARFVGAEPRIHFEPERKRRALPHIRRHSRVS